MSRVNCPHCKTEVAYERSLGGTVVACPECGKQFRMPQLEEREIPEAEFVGPQTVVFRAPPKSSGLAAVLSFFWSGLGQIYNGQLIKGFLLIVLQLVNTLLMYVLIGFVTYFIVWIYGIVDAYRVAEDINRRSSYPSP